MLINVDVNGVITGALVNAIAVAGHRLSVALGSLSRRRREHDLTVARWFATYELTSQPPDLPNLSEADEQFQAIVGGDELQAALHELMAVRLTDASEADATRARDVVALTLSAVGPEVAQALADYYDDQIRALVARLEADAPPLLGQIRSDAFATRMISILNAIERHFAALSTRPSVRTEAKFLADYRHHVIDQHGQLEPPDFDRRRRVAIDDIYVATSISSDPVYERSADPASPYLNVWQLADRLDRSVLLGDPGSGKTTAANVLMNHFASASNGRIPFLVILRDYAVHDPPERSVVGHIEHNLETLYQCPPPPGLVDLLLLSGHAVVIFDGLDELLDTNRRRDVTTRVEHFCAEYPLAPVLVTSRLIGYDQARLDDRQFTTYELAGFGDDQVAEYARKWFAQDPDSRTDDAEAFLAESQTIPDLRANPLMLALLCILYRGRGSLPRNRAEVYEQCATLLFHRWDSSRRIQLNLRAGHLLDPLLRHLAWSLYTHSDTRSAITEHRLVQETTAFLRERSLESADEARLAAREIVEFCRGRMWVFTDAGITAYGEKLYAFTHRTFLEYFAAAYIAYESDLPEQLARTIGSRIAMDEWNMVGELAIQVKDRTSSVGAQRVYGALLGDTASQTPDLRANTLRFLAQCLQSVDPSPWRVRELTRAILNSVLAVDHNGQDAVNRRTISGHQQAIGQLLANCGPYRESVAEEIADVFNSTLSQGDPGGRVRILRLVLSLPDASPRFLRRDDPLVAFWESRVDRLVRIHPAALADAARHDAFVRCRGLTHGVISTRQALQMPDGFALLFRDATGFLPDSLTRPHLGRVFRAILDGWPAYGEPTVADDMAAIGEYLLGHRGLPWLRGPIGDWHKKAELMTASGAAGKLSQVACLGTAAIVCILMEKGEPTWSYEGWGSERHSDGLGPMRGLLPYLERRAGAQRGGELPVLPVPDDFKQIFRDWAEGQVDFTA